MKTLFQIITIFCIILVLSACAPVAQQFVDLPEGQELAITGIFITVVALLFDFSIGKFPWLSFFKQYQEAWAVALAAVSITALENALPTGSDEISINAVALLIAIVLYLLGRTWLIRRGVKSFLA